MKKGMPTFIVFLSACIIIILLSAIQIHYTPYPEKVVNHWTSLGMYKVTAYCSCERCCRDYADGITASGYNTTFGGKFVAAPADFPFTEILLVEQYGVTAVLDRGGKINGKKLDVWFPTHQEAKVWGVKNCEVFIYNE